MVLTALKPAAELRTTPPRLFPVDWRIGSFAGVLGDVAFQGWLRASLIVAVISMLTEVTLGLVQHGLTPAGVRRAAKTEKSGKLAVLPGTVTAPAQVGQM